jgi:hypothetical protein
MNFSFADVCLAVIATSLALAVLFGFNLLG